MSHTTYEFWGISGLTSVGFVREAGLIVAVAPLAVMVGSVVRTLRILPPEPLGEGKGGYDMAHIRLGLPSLRSHTSPAATKSWSRHSPGLIIITGVRILCRILCRIFIAGRTAMQYL